MKSTGLLAGTLLLAMGSASAATVFAPTDGDVNFILSTLSSGTQLAMFDDADQSFSGSNLDIPLPQVVTFSGPDGSGDFTAENEASETLTLTGSDWFILGISTDNGTTWSGDTAVTSLGADAYEVEFSDGSVVEVDVRVVPLPAAAWLFGTGLLGIAAVARRRS